MRVCCADFAAVRCNREIAVFVSAAFSTKGGERTLASAAYRPTATAAADLHHRWKSASFGGRRTEGSIIGKACGWTSNSGDQLGDAGVSVNVELSVSFELVKYLLALVGLVGSYDISTEAIKRHALVATTLSEHLDITCSARVRVVREHFV